MSCRDFKELFLPAHSSVILRTVSTRRVQIVSRSGGQPSSRKLFLIHEFLLLRKTNSVSFKHRYVQIECEQMLSCKEPGGLFAICSQGNFPLWGNFRAFPIVGKFPCERGLYRARRSAGKPCLRHYLRSSNSLSSSPGVPKKRRSIFFGVGLGELAHHSANADDETEGVALFSQVRFR